MNFIWLKLQWNYSFMSGLLCLYNFSMLLLVDVICSFSFWIVFLCINTVIYLSILLLVDIWQFSLLGCYEQCWHKQTCLCSGCTCVCISLEYLEENETVGWEAWLCSAFMDTAQQFSKWCYQFILYSIKPLICCISLPKFGIFYFSVYRLYTLT